VRRILLILAACAFALAFVPIKTLNSPGWNVLVVDQNGHPIPGITVRLSYQNYSAEDKTHETDGTTDNYGHATFTPQALSASGANRLIYTLRSALGGVHASFGPHASVFAFGKGLEGFDVDSQKDVVVEWTGKSKSMESRIVVHPR
jgi:Bacterial Ig-like domain (group 1)